MASKAKSKKRAAADSEGGSRKKRKSAYEQDESLLDTELGVNKGYAFMDPQLLADHLAQKTTRFGSDLSPIELADLYISPSSIHDTTSWLEDRTLTKLPGFLEKFAKKPEDLGKAPKQKGSPHTIIVTGAGLRAADVVRAVRKYQTKKCSVAKLFAKHMKIEETTKFLQEHHTGVAVGTPTRLNDLVENGALSLENLERIVVDASHIDQKKRGVLDMKDTMLPVARWLARKEFKERYTAGDKPLQLLFY
ncbi:U3-containing 90S pre-ribosomal complex subunit-domain containing protein [Pseudomassariella vexata]|uniref:U3-containing 90S pre-ribosomal complex subunit-domain containing protein n=1 Tax=Pseudomassariella vexata TaxID=1141098 RepID=A0A1Y2DPC2_9PEZI|nr:U3-containing 90S pre-ribosomal complex subunit-domain containing protein [Pseudomassariella vexata]ORY60505.1 U3-containing 90S pre-ribosomal complex subunit-domain containing protein [Pseudomassariella vexata]